MLNTIDYTCFRDSSTNQNLTFVSAPDEYCDSTGVIGVWINEETQELEWNICYSNGRRYVYGYIIRQKTL